MTDTDQSEFKLVLRGLTREDYPQVKQVMDRVYADLGGAWTAECDDQYTEVCSRIRIF